MGIVRHKLSDAAMTAVRQRIAQKREQRDTFNFIDAQANAWSEIKNLYNESRFFAHAPETANGPGSTLTLTEDLRVWLPGLFARHNIKTMLDAPCGDWNWVRMVDLGDIAYLGWDVEPELIEMCQRRLAEGDCNLTTCAPNAAFATVNLLDTPTVPEVDLILCRDFLICLPTAHVSAVLEKFKASGSRYLLTSHYPDTTNDFVYKPEDFTWLGYAERPVNLEAAPFDLGPKLEAFPEKPGPGGIISTPHELALFELT